MRVEQAKTLHAEDQLSVVDIIRNPSNLEQWFIIIIDREGRTFFLLEETGEPLVFEDIEKLITLLKEIGFKKAQIHL